VIGDGGCARYALALCEVQRRCVLELFTYLYPDMASCQAAWGAICAQQVSLPSTSYTADQALACAAGLDAVSCEDWNAARDPAACSPTPGALANGSACGDDPQCQSTICRVPANETCGVCGPKVGPGGARSSDAECPADLSCVNRTCRTRPVAGDPGTSGAGCRGLLVCKNSVCAPGAKAGETCSPGTCDVELPLFCASGGVCRSTSYAKRGEACDNTVGAFCGGGGICRTGAAGGAGTCVAPAADGAPYDDAQGPGCGPTATCVGGICRTYSIVGCR
jgi:hypothetical protein